MRALCILAIVAAGTQAWAGETRAVVTASPTVEVQATTVQSFSTEPQTFVSPAETISVPAVTKTFTIPGQSVTIPQRTVTIPGKNYALVETTQTNVCVDCVPQTRVATDVCGPNGCGPDPGGVDVDVDVTRRGIFSKFRNRERRERKLFRRR